MSGFFSRLKAGMARSGRALTQNLSALMGDTKLTDAQFDTLEEILIAADMGVDAAHTIASTLQAKHPHIASEDDLRVALATEIATLLAPAARALQLPADARPAIILVVGVNGTGKTTCIGKLAHHYTAQGKRVMVAAGDTYRAAAAEQLHIWAQRVRVPIISDTSGGDAAALAYRAVACAQQDAHDILIIDTAGRLQTNQNLMAELSKIHRVIQKHDNTAPHATLLVLDATTGQNALAQARAFGDAAQISGLILTKLDSTARGGMVVPIATQLNLPVHFIGTGEGLDDLHAFDAVAFAAALTDTSPDKIKVAAKEA